MPKQATPIIDAEDWTPDATHPLNGERWHGRRNGSAGEQTFQTQREEYALEVFAEGDIHLFDISSTEAEEVFNAKVKTNTGMRLITRIVAEAPDMFSNDPERTVTGSPVPQHKVSTSALTSDHSLYHGRWRDGGYTDLGTVAYDSRGEEYTAEFFNQDSEYDEPPYMVKLSQREESGGEEDTRAVAMVKNAEAIWKTLDVLMRYPDSF